MLLGISLSVSGATYGGQGAPYINLTNSTVAENAANGTTIGVLSVGNPVGGVTYTFAETADPDGKFGVSGTNLNKTAAMDYETATSHTVTITATGSDASTVGPTVFTIFVTDIDEVAPTITSANSASVAENSTLSHTLTANESVTWTVTGGADQAKFEVSGSTLRWASNGTKNYDSPDDADANNTYVVQVTATDSASNATNQTITITVTNVLEAATLGALTLDNYDVDEDEAIGTVVGAILGKTTGSSLSLTDSAGGKFAIDGTNIETAAALDYETADEHSITIRETLADSPNSPRDSVLLIDVNDITEGGGTSAAMLMLASETDGFAFSAHENSLAIKDTTTPANNYDGTINGKLTNAGTSPKTRIKADGTLGWAPHNLVLNSGTPATQTVTVIIGEIYTVSITGSGSVVLTNAGIGTVSAGSPVTITASSTSLVCTVSGSPTTMQVNRGSEVLEYLATTGSARFGIAIDYSSGTGRVLVEEARTNLALQSNNLASGSWSDWININTRTANSAVAPDGTTTAAQIVFPATNGSVVYQSAGVPGGSINTASIWLKVASGTASIELRIAETGFANPVTLTCNLTTTWQRFTVTSGANAPGAAYMSIGQPAGSNFGVVTLLAWGGQIETSSTASSFIPTLGTSVTRARDIPYILLSSLKYGTVNTLLFEGTVTSPGIVYFGSVDDDSSNNENSVFFHNSDTRYASYIFNSGGQQAYLQGPVFAPYNVFKILKLRLKANDFRLLIDDTTSVDDASGTVGSPTKLKIGCGHSSTNGVIYIDRVAQVPRDVTNANLPTWMA